MSGGGVWTGAYILFEQSLVLFRVVDFWTVSGGAGADADGGCTDRGISVTSYDERPRLEVVVEGGRCYCC